MCGNGPGTSVCLEGEKGINSWETYDFRWGREFTYSGQGVG